MVLRGFTCAAWTGWLSGAFFSSNPLTWSVFTTWKHPYTFYVLFINFILGSLITDFFLNVYQVADRKASYVTRIILTGFLASNLSVTVLLRFYFIFRAKAISLFVKSVEFHPTSLVLTPVARATGVQTPRLRRSYIVISWITFGCLLGNGTLLCWSTLSQQQSAASWFIVVGKIPYFIFGLTLGFIPGFLSSFFGFSFVTITLYNLVWIFEDYCAQLEHYVKVQGEHHSSLHLYFGGGVGAGGKIGMAGAVDTERALFEKPFLRPTKIDTLVAHHQEHTHWKQQILIGQFKQIKELFKTYDLLAGPLTLCIVVSSTVSIIQASHDILNSSDKQDQLVASAWLNLLSHLLFLTVLNTGHHAKRSVVTWQNNLKEAVALVPNGPTKLELSSLVKIVTTWKWRMSAAGFFNVDRSLMGGIISTMMTYVVILFQLHQG